MTPLKTNLNLKGEGIVDIMLTTCPEGQTSSEFYGTILVKMEKNVEPKLHDYIKSLNVEETLATIDDMKTLEGVEIVFITEEFKATLADELDLIEELGDVQKGWLFGTLLNTFHHGAVALVSPFFQKRAQQLADKKRIITV